MSGRPDCHVVIRAAGERTEAACAHIAAQELGQDRVTVIHEVPFSEAVRRGFEIGAEAGRDWTLCLDADVLLAEGAIADLCRAAEAEAAGDGRLFEIDALVADKLLGQVRAAGVHLYRTALLPEALQHVRFDPKKRRPESQVKKAMRARGCRTGEVALVAGLHDFEQYHRDIFRKVFTHTRKHERFMDYAARYWRRLGQVDADMRVAYLSCCLARGVNELTDFSDVPENEKVAIDLRAFPRNIDAILAPAGLTEKAPLDADGIAPGAVRRILDEFQISPEFLRDRPAIQMAGQSRLQRLRGEMRAWGTIGALRSLGGRRLRALGRRLDGREEV